MTRVGTTTEQETVVSTLARHRRRRPRRPDGAAGDHRGRRRRRPARDAVLVRDQAAVRLARAGAAHQGAGRRRCPRGCAATARCPRRCRPSRSSRRATRSRWTRPSAAWSRAATSGSRSPRSTRCKAVREKFEEYGLDARAFSGLKIAAVGDKTAAAIAAWGLRADLVPVRRAVRRRAARGLAAVRRRARPDQPGLPAARRHRHRDPRRRPGRPRLGGRRRHGLPHRAGRPAAGADPRGDQDRQVRRGRVHLVLDGAQPGRHRRQAARVDGHRGDRAGHGQDRRGARPAGRRARAERRRSRRSSTRSPTSAPPAGRRCSRPASRSPGRPSAGPSTRGARPRST